MEKELLTALKTMVEAFNVKKVEPIIAFAAIERARHVIELAETGKTPPQSKSADDITIHWGNKPVYNRHKVALEIQDACNLRALAREFVKVVDAAADEKKDGNATNADSAVALFLSKFESLCHADARFSAAYDECSKRATESARG